MAINQGLGGPKGKSKGVPDGQSVNIPTLPPMSLRITKFSNLSELLDSRCSLKDFQEWTECVVSAAQTQMSKLPRKASQKILWVGSVPQTDTGGLV